MAVGGFKSFLWRWFGRAAGPVAADIPAVVVSRIHVRSAIGASAVGIKPVVAIRLGKICSVVEASPKTVKAAIAPTVQSVKSVVHASSIVVHAGGS